jgi:hypothetical protein
VAQVAADLAISEQTIYIWRRQHLIDTGQLPGTTSSVSAELLAARRRIAELDAEVAIQRRAAHLLGEVVSQETVRGDRGDGLAQLAGSAGLPGPRGVRVGLLRLAHRLLPGPCPRNAQRTARSRRSDSSRRATGVIFGFTRRSR